MIDCFVKITSKRGRYYCARMTHPAEPTIYPVLFLDGRLNKICNDPTLKVEFLNEAQLPDEIEKGAVLSAQLKAEIEAGAKAKKKKQKAKDKIESSGE